MNSVKPDLRERLSENIPARKQPRRIIYDFGANNGDDIPYYLKKAELVVAVEANPALCCKMEQRFATAIKADRLRVENCVLVGEEKSAEVCFYLHKRHHVLGQFPRPDESVSGDYDQVLVPAKTATQVLREHGDPYYIKMDIERSEEHVLRDLFLNRVRPAYISAESTSVQVFALLAAMGEYSAFKLVEGATVAKKYRNHLISVNGGRERYSFPAHSAGPFGEDIEGEWMNTNDLFEELTTKKMGWRDIHATNLVTPSSTSRLDEGRYMRRHLRGWVLAKLRSIQGKMRSAHHGNGATVNSLL